MKHKLEKTELNRLILAFRRDLSIYKSPNSNYNEQNTRQQYIDNFLRLLGWDISNPQRLSFNDREVVAEEYSNRNDRPDYTIRMYGSSIFYVEAKKVSVDISSEKEPALQARRYGWNSGHKISVLTNFEYLAIYTTFEAPTDFDVVSKFRYKLYHFTEYVDKFDEIYQLLSRQSVLNGTFEEWTNRIAPENATKLSLDQTFLAQLNEWRVRLANDLYKSETLQFKDIVHINDSVQTLLNQIIFLRFAEDNNFESAEQLKISIVSHTNYKEYFKKLDSKYNSGIFENAEIISNVQDETLRDIVENLYFPNTSYNFSVIDLTILSRIYENFLQQEIVLSDEALILDKTKSAKIKSVVSTPDNIAKLMVQKGLREVIEGLTPKEIMGLKLADIAVGSGIFLIECFNYIENYLIDWYSEKDNVAPNPYIIPFYVKKEIIKNSFYGFDVNNQAVQLTRFSLVLRLLSNEKRERISEITPILPSLVDNIICGNSLINEDDIDIDKLSFKEYTEIQPMELGKLPEKYFDFIIGNPPYLATEDIKNSTEKSEIDAYFLKYKSTFRQYDKYFLFIERCLGLLKNEGISILLVPNKFFTVGAAKNLRNFIVENKGITSIIDFKSKQLFKDVITYLSIIKFGKFDNNKILYSAPDSVTDAFEETQFLEYSLSELGSKPWFLTNDRLLRDRYQKLMEKFPSTTKYIKPVNGIQTSANQVFIIEKKYIVAETDELIEFHILKGRRDEKFSIEKELLRDFYQPPKNEVGKSYNSTSSTNFVIFPYMAGNLIPYNIMSQKYPSTLKYFEAHKEQLLPKSMGGQTRDVQPEAKEFYQFGREQFLKEANDDKIIVGVMSNQPNFNIDRSGSLFASGGTAGYIGIFKKEESPYELEYVQAWLSHPMTDIIFKTIGSSFEGDFYTHGTATYQDIPFLEIDFDDNRQTLQYNNIVELVREIEKLNLDRTSAILKRKEFIDKQKKIKINKINDIIDSLIKEILD